LSNAELAALVDRPGRLRCHVARDPARERELPKQPPQALGVATDVRVDLAVGALEIGVGDQARPAVTGTGHVQHAEIARPDEPVQMRVDEVQTGCGAPVPEEPGLDVVKRQRLSQQRVVQQIDLTDRQIVRRPPVTIEQGELTLAHRGGAVGTHRNRRPTRARRLT
jgi:hypothetical protein